MSRKSNVSGKSRGSGKKLASPQKGQDGEEFEVPGDDDGYDEEYDEEYDDEDEDHT